MTDTPSDAHPEPVAVAAYPDRGEAEVTKAHLAANGIEAIIMDDAEGGALPIDLEGGVYVVVHAQDAELARQVLAPDETS
jgi:Putative prokaryotic signal transducing protein